MAQRIKSEFEDLRNSLLQLEKETPPNYWEERAEIPLLCKKRPDSYEDGTIPDEDIISLAIDTRGAQERNPTNLLVCASTGVGKSRRIKNIIKGYHKQGYNILYIEPKGEEFLYARRKGNGTHLAPHDINETLPIVSYVPEFVHRTLILNKRDDIIKRSKFFCPDISKLNYREIWQSFGIPDKAADMIVGEIHKGVFDIDKFMFKIKGSKMMQNTKGAAISALENLQGTGTFGTNNRLELEKEWKKGNIVCVNYYSREGAFMNTDIGLILDLVRDIGIEETRHGYENVTKKLIVFDDAFYYAGTSASMATKQSGEVNLAIRNIINCQNNFRTWGIDTILVVQDPSPASIVKSLMNGCTSKLISYTEDPSSLRGKIPLDALGLLSNTNSELPMLDIDEENYVFQWVYVKGKTRWTVGYSFDCSVGCS